MSYLAAVKEIPKYTGCFVCGDENPRGLQARFFYEDGKAVTKVEAAAQYEGYAGIYHGGIVATLLDEVMIKAIIARDKLAVTAEMTVKFLHPVRVGDTLEFSGWITATRKRVHYTKGEVRAPDGLLYATAQGTYVEAKPELKDDLLRSLS